MDTDPLPWQLTVAQLREALESANDHQIVVFGIPPGDVHLLRQAAEVGMTLVFNVAADGGDGPVFRLSAAQPAD